MKSKVEELRVNADNTSFTEFDRLWMEEIQEYESSPSGHRAIRILMPLAVSATK